MIAQTTQRFDFHVDVIDDDIDDMGHVNNTVYLRWVQTAVVRHWRRFAPTEAIASRLWVALAHDIRYRHPALPHDHVVVKLLLEKLQGAKAYYRTRIERGDDILAEVKSCWCCLDAVTKKPARLARDTIARFLPPDP
ncbi:MAG: thioesterase family protein [Rhodospirillaceae bacterium]|nr:thioesterase family protein [Rhodospirillaceae bacterium]